MIKTDDFFDDFSGMSGIWVDDRVVDDSELAQISNFILDNNVSLISVPVSVTEKIWPWIENRNIRIFNRFAVDFDDNADVTMSEIARNVNDSFRHGANGAQIMIKPNELEQFVNLVMPIKNDLFFDHDLVIELNIDNVDNADWVGIFDLLNRVQANAVMITAVGDKFDASSDFVGRIYAMFESWNFDGALHLMFGKNMMRTSQVLRLAQKMRPAVAEKILVFMPY